METSILACLVDSQMNTRDGKRWIGLPGRPYVKDGATLYSSIIDFDSDESRNSFQQLALAAITHLLERGR